MAAGDALALTTPITADAEGQTRVADAQDRLDHNAFGNFNATGEGSPVGTFGPLTAGACHRAKYWLGFWMKDTDPTYGQRLDDYLRTGRLPPAYTVRRNLRLRAKRSAKKLKALRILATQIGVKESPPNSNRVKYSLWYGLIGSWCAMFQCWGGKQAGEEWALQGKRFAYVPYMDAAAAAGSYGMSIISAVGVEPGDLATFDWERDGTSDHVGRFEKWIVRGQTFYSIEGNTAVGNDSNGGQVMRRERSVSLVHHFIHLVD